MLGSDELDDLGFIPHDAQGESAKRVGDEIGSALFQNAVPEHRPQRLGRPLGAKLVVEVVMAWPGIGALAYDAVLKRDIFLVVDLVQLSALMLLVGNTVGDILLRLVDPRTATA